MICTILSDGKELQLTCKNEAERPILTIKQKIWKILKQLIYEDCHEFWLNCEYGIPLWTAEMLCFMKKYYDVKLHIAVPYEEQTTDWKEEQRDRYFRLHEKADRVVFVNKQYHAGCYHDAERYMLEHSNLLCMFGSPTNHLKLFELQNTDIGDVPFIFHKI